MKVKDLIRKLKSLDQNAIVATRDHDNSWNEISGWPRDVTQQDASELDESGLGRKGVIVVIEC